MMSKPSRLLPLSVPLLGLLCTLATQAVANTQAAIEETVVLEARLDNHFYLDDFFVGIQKKGQLYLPLKSFSKAAEFDILVETQSGRAGGSFFSQRQTLSLDVPAGFVTLNGKRQALDPTQVFVNHDEDDIFVESGLLGQWLGVRFSHDALEQMLVIKSKQLFPAEQRLERQRKRDGLSVVGQTMAAKTKQSIHEAPYHLFSLPSLRANLSARYTPDSASKFEVTSNVLALGDLAWLNGELAISGLRSSNNDPTVRIRLGRKAKEGGLLGPLDATSFAVGHVGSPLLPLMSNNVSGRGVTVSSLPIGAADAFGTTEIRGPVLPGYEVELYRNGVLIDYQTADDSGEYRFSNVPMVGGKNKFKIELYGPGGKRDTVMMTRMVDQAYVSKGEFAYRVAAVDKSASALLTETRYATAELYYGLSDASTLSFQAATTPLGGTQRTTLAGAGLRTHWGNVFLESMAAIDQNGKKAGTVSAQGNLLKASLSLSHERYQNGYKSEENDANSSELKGRTVARINRSFKVFPVGFAFRGEHQQWENNREQLNLTARLSSLYAGYSLFNTIDSTTNTTKSTRDTRVGGQFRVSKTKGSWRFVGDLNYRVSPNEQLDTVGLSAAYKAKQYHLSLSAQHSVDSSKTALSLNGTLYSNKLFNLNANASYDSETDDISAYLGVSIEMGYNPSSRSYAFAKNKHISRGMLVPNIFYDENASGVFDAGETRLNDVDLKIDNMFFSLKDQQHIANLKPYQSLTVALDDASLPDPFTASKEDSFMVRTRPGVQTVIDIPVVNTGEVEGIVAFVENNTQRKESGVKVNLLPCKSEKVIKTARSFDDGFYLFESVKPGCYRLAISDQQMKALGYIAPSPVSVTISTDGGSTVAKDIFIKGRLNKKEAQ